MRMRVSITIVLAVLFALPLAVFAQSAPAKPKPAAISVTLEYFEDNSGIFDVKDGTGASVPSPQFGDELKAGWTVITGKGDVAELKLTHTGTIIKVAQNTNFTLNGLRTETGGQDAFSLTVGKIRTVAGKASGKDQYQIKTQSAVCGVRGSDVVIESIPGQSDTLSTLEGTGWIQNAAGDAIDVAQGYFVDALGAAFQAMQIPPDILQGLQDEMKFIKLDVNEALAANKAYQESLQNAQAASSGTEPATTTTTTQGGTPPAPQKSSFMDGIMAKLRDILGMEIGSVNISGTTYSSVVIQPTFKIGSLKMALYLPIIYTGDMFNPADWYQPLGNNEWSFGTDAKYKGDTWGMVGDIAADVLLKIRYIEWGQQRDPFFFKLGNLSDITIGHGLIMRDFANDADFPSVRRVGANLGLDFGGFGMEAMVNDAAAPEILGGRMYFRPIPSFKMALGFSTIVDLDPAKDWVGGPAAVGNPLFINPGVDLDLPFFESDAFSIVAFADGAAMLPYFRAAPTDSAYSNVYANTSSGFALNAIYDPSSALPVKNWGFATGLFGNLISRDFTWRVEFRDYTGAFVPQFYSSGYERQRTEMLQSVLAYLQDPSSTAYDNPVMGVFGEGGMIFQKLFSLKLSYFWPWAQDASGNFTFSDDHFVAKFTLEKGVIPVVNIWGSVSYERTDFVPTLLNGSTTGLKLFDANTVVSATVNYPVTDTVDVSLLYTTTAKRDSAGNLVYPTSGTALQMALPEMDTTLSITTSIHL